MFIKKMTKILIIIMLAIGSLSIFVGKILQRYKLKLPVASNELSEHYLQMKRHGDLIFNIGVIIIIVAIICIAIYIGYVFFKNSSLIKR